MSPANLKIFMVANSNFLFFLCEKTKYGDRTFLIPNFGTRKKPENEWGEMK